MVKSPDNKTIHEDLMLDGVQFRLYVRKLNSKEYEVNFEKITWKDEKDTEKKLYEALRNIHTQMFSERLSRLRWDKSDS